MHLPGLPDAGLGTAEAVEQRCFQVEPVSTKVVPRRRPTVSFQNYGNGFLLFHTFDLIANAMHEPTQLAQ